MCLGRFPAAAGLVAAASLLLPAGPLAAATVVASRGPSAGQYPVGQKVDAGGRIVLAAGDMVTLLDGKGTRVLTGPGTFPVAQSASGTSRQSVFAALVRDRTSVRVRTGSVRAGPNGEPPRSPNLWYVDVSRPGTYCLSDPANVRLWRPLPGTEATLAIEGPAGSDTVSFGRQDLVAPWDVRAVPVRAGAPYVIRGPETGASVTVRFQLIEGEPGSMEDLAGKLIEKGCHIQLDLLAATVQLPAGS